ncbi:peptide-methionine (S)-S-oxide reductase MsrA [Arcobacter sp. LA11]|uniref:peptide-methionine (S)-S-oxide reductase MsrA n=1 Tax=Arcobacter sp. LA11 TaxID=1898176 RepID=UPI0009328D35|nr:peptide-methionine (S)-S-oxide reductase MsrA [Arcobacter sp. LA11]
MRKYFLLLFIGIGLLLASSMDKEIKIEKPMDKNLKAAYFAGGCFWGVEHHFEKKKGVKDAISGYMGGWVKNPGYYDVVKGKTGHVETVKVVYDPKIVTFEELTKLFFEIHDPEQRDGQGPDIGSQYLSGIFYHNEEEKNTAQGVIDILTKKGYDVATSLVEVNPFYIAEGFHQDYYARTGKTPYCHIYKKIF